MKPLFDLRIIDLIPHVNRFGRMDASMLPRSREKRTCSQCGKPSGPYATCREHREAKTIVRILKKLSEEKKIVRITDGRGVKGGSLWQVANPEIHDLDRKIQRVGRNSKCPCGSGKKYKKCCETQHNEVCK